MVSYEEVNGQFVDMTRLPQPGSDNGQWGQILNDFLAVEHNTDGSLKKTDDISSALTTANNAIPNSQKGANNGVAELDSSGKIPISRVPDAVEKTANLGTSGHAAAHDATTTALGQRPTGSATSITNTKVPTVHNGSLSYIRPTELNIKHPKYGAKGDFRALGLAQITSGTNILGFSYGYTFTSRDIGKHIRVVGAGAGGASLKTTITGVGTGGNAGKALLGANASTTVTSAVAHFGTDDTVAIQAALDEAGKVTASNISDQDTGDEEGAVRTVFIPKGWYLFTHLEVPSRIRLIGEGWSDFVNLSANGISTSRRGGSYLQQKWDVNDDALWLLPYDPAASAPYTGPLTLEGFQVTQDLDNTSGSGIVSRKLDGTLTNVQDGFRLRDVSSNGFANHGYKLGAAVPFYPELCRALCNGRQGGVGMYLNLSTNNMVCDLRGLSGDMNKDGLVHALGSDGTNTRGVLIFDSLKSEGYPNYYDPSVGPSQKTAVILEKMGGCRVMVFGAHHTRAPGEESSPGVEYAPGPLIRLRGSATWPMLEWFSVKLRVISNQTNLTDIPCIVYDENTSTVLATTNQTSGRLGPGGIEFTRLDAAPAYSLFSDGTATTRRPAGTGEGIGYPDHQVAGVTPMTSFLETDAPADRKHTLFVMSGGTLSCRVYNDTGTNLGNAWEVTNTSNVASLTVGASGGKLGFFGTGPSNKKTITGSRGGNAALADLLTQLAATGLIIDNTTA